MTHIYIIVLIQMTVDLYVSFFSDFLRICLNYGNSVRVRVSTVCLCTQCVRV